MEPNERIKTTDGRAHNVRCYDNGGTTADRYTVVYIDQPERVPAMYAAFGMNAEPFHPQGIGMHTQAMPGPHLGERIAFASLPADCQKAILQSLCE